MPAVTELNDEHPAGFQKMMVGLLSQAIDRFALVAVALASCHIAPLYLRYLYFDRLVDGATAVVRPASFWVIDTLTAFGTLMLGESFTRTAGPYSTRSVRVAASYFLAFTLVTTAIALVWLLLDRRRSNYSKADGWLHSYSRHLLALGLMPYALSKIVPTQFGFLPPGELLRPLGQLSRFDLLWTFMSASSGYTVFAGTIEFLGACLLLFERTALLGGLVSCAALINVVAIDMAYDVRGPLLTAIVLLGLALVVVRPYARPLLRLLLASPVEPQAVFPRASGEASLLGAVVKGILLTGLSLPLLSHNFDQRRIYFGAGHPVWGLFDVEQMGADGKPTDPPNGGQTWKRVGSAGRTDSAGMTVQLADGSIRTYRFEDDTSHQTWTLRSARSSATGQGGEEAAVLHYMEQADGTILLTGRVGQQQANLRLRRVDAAAWPLLDTQAR